jgi:oligoribonuclease NrnB/cAMP/cGMP phosphodiesterase (DHH superfamily)
LYYNLSNIKGEKIMKKDLVLCITDNDLDGVASAVLARLCFENIDIFYIDKKKENMFLRLKSLLTGERVKIYTHIIVSDISLNVNLEGRRELMERWEELSKDRQTLWVDHHNSSNWMKGYKNVKVNLSGEHCGASMLFKELEKMINERYGISRLGEIFTLVEGTRLYDTWRWARFDIKWPVYFNELFLLKGQKEFEKEIFLKIKNDKKVYDYEYSKLGFMLYNKKMDRIEELEDDTIYIPYYFQDEEYFVGVVQTKENGLISLLANKLLDGKIGNRVPDFVLVFSRDRIHIRSKFKERFDCTKFLNEYNGSGSYTNGSVKISNAFTEQLIVEKLLKYNPMELIM